MAAHQKKAREEGAHVVLIDESGFFLNPLVRRTWAPRGSTPVLTGFGRHRDKVSTIAAISVAPRRRRLGLYWRTDPQHYIDATAVVGFLRTLLRHLRGKVIVAGAEDKRVADILGWDAARNVEEALDMAKSHVGRTPSITHVHIPPIQMVDVTGTPAAI